jgi:hypothetical protein
MNEFLNSLKADLLDRRLLPLLALVGVALVAAVGYMVLGGGSSVSTSPSLRPTSPGPSGIAVSEQPANPALAVAETTSGAPAQRKGYAHDPFTPLPGTAKPAGPAVTKPATASTTPAGSTTTGSKPTLPTKVEPAPAAPSKPSPPRKPQTIYHVTTLFGAVPAGTALGTGQLASYLNLKLLTPLPSAKAPLIVFRGVTAGGTNAIFTVVGEVILHGSALCLPSVAQCQEIELGPGQAEQLEYLPPNGQTVTYELRVLSAAAAKASSAAVAKMRSGVSQAGRALLRNAGLVAIPGLRFSSVVGVLTYVGHPASAARAHSR